MKHETDRAIFHPHIDNKPEFAPVLSLEIMLTLRDGLTEFTIYLTPEPIYLISEEIVHISHCLNSFKLYFFLL